MPESCIASYNPIVEHLKECAQNNRFPHSLLFTEKEGCGAILVVLEVIKNLFGGGESATMVERLAHPDVHFIFPINISSALNKEKKPELEEFYPMWRELLKENPYFSEQELYDKLGIENRQGVIGVAEALGLIKRLMLSPFESDKRAIVIMFPERMSQEAANKLLKSVEEPQPGTCFFFISHNPHRIMATILSRCCRIDLAPIPQQELASILENKEGIAADEALYWAQCAGGSYGKALAMIRGGGAQERDLKLFERMVTLASQRDLPQLCTLADEISSLGREVQKQFCKNALESIRRLFMLGCGMEGLAMMPPAEVEVYRRLSSLVNKNFYSKAAELMNSAVEQLESNVNPKFIFCDICNRLYFYI